MEIKDLKNIQMLNEMLQKFKSGIWYVIPFTKGNTNIVTKIKLCKSHPLQTILKDVDDIVDYDECYVMRIFGSHGLIDRNVEYKNCILLVENKMAPIIRHQFKNGIIQDFIEGQELTNEDLKIEMKNIAQKLYEWHQIEIVENESVLFNTLIKWKNLCMREHKSLLNEFDLNVDEIIQNYKKHISLAKKININSFKLGFCHNDLLSSNIIKINDNSVFFIDYEYAGVNYVAFDIANHFSEYCGYDFNTNDFPDEKCMKQFLKYYKNQEIYDEVVFFVPLTNLYWGLWALLRKGTFDYHSYGIKRINEFIKMYKLLNFYK